MVVMKFGGTSLGSGERILKAAKLIYDERARQPVVVVSAMSQVTNSLVELSNNAAEGVSPDVLTAGLQHLHQQHYKAARALRLEPDVEETLMTLLDGLTTKLADSLNNIALVGELTPRTHDLVLAFGERFTVHLLATALQSLGLSAVALEGSELIITDSNFGLASPLLAASRKQMRPKLQRLIKANVIPIITGFMGATSDGIVTTLGRGGSDYSATIIGHCLNAEAVWIWTDVDGVMTADPRTVNGAHTIDDLSYDEAAELSYFGAKVLHPRTVVPMALSDIPIWIKNSLRPSSRGTKITSVAHLHPDGVKAMTVLRHLSLITVQGKGIQGVYGVAAKVFNALAEHQISVLFISQASSENNISLVVSGADGAAAAQALRTAFKAELKVKNLEAVKEEAHLAMIAVVGEGMRSHNGVAGRVFSAVGQAGINIMAIAQGSSERNISFIVKEAEATRTLQAIHDELHLENGHPKKRVPA